MAKQEEEKFELEREYVIPLRRRTMTVPNYRRAKKSVRVLKEFLAKHMRVENRDIRKVKMDRYLNNEIWFRGIKNPPAKIKVKAKKKDGIVYVELAEIPEYVKFVMAKDKKAKEAGEKVKSKKSGKQKESKDSSTSQEEKKEQTEEQSNASKNIEAGKVKEEKEKEKATAEAGFKEQKLEAKQARHETPKPAKQTQPRRMTLQK